MVVYGLRYLLEMYLHRQWTIEDVEKADKFYRCGLSALIASAEPYNSDAVWQPFS